MIDQVRPSQLPAWLAQHAGERPLVLDVREPVEWQFASVAPEGAQLVRISMGEIPSRLQELDPERPVACLCHHGVRSMQVAMYLARQGFGQVANITGGTDLWSQEVDPGVARY